ncbi:hypothetical protein DH2020_029930 [Rehmannia glutinosa]|uniref:PWWP domain-containing protein n=1 Tax=Rehmannia glutinosa TaxID=99300 RepID=A0ABR0VQP9_REHGL
MPNEVAGVAVVSDITRDNILPEITVNAELPIYSTNVSSLDRGEIEGRISETNVMDGKEERKSDGTYHVEMEVDSELGNEEHASETDKWKLSYQERVRPASFLRMNQPSYLSSPENEGLLAISDLVWEKAIKYYKKDSYLVAYFGDRTFAWNDSSLLKPFRSHFSQIEKQSNSEASQNAVRCALEEVSRRVELGLTCSCIPKDAYATMETQITENTGIREESSRRFSVDHSSRASYFEPDKLLEYVRELAPRASSGADRLHLVIARAQLSTFYHFKGYRPPICFPSPGELLEINTDAEKISDEIIASQKRKHTSKDSSESKERSLTELMGVTEHSPDAKEESFAEESISLSPVKK